MGKIISWLDLGDSGACVLVTVAVWWGKGKQTVLDGMTFFLKLVYLNFKPLCRFSSQLCGDWIY